MNDDSEALHKLEICVSSLQSSVESLQRNVARIWESDNLTRKTLSNHEAQLATILAILDRLEKLHSRTISNGFAVITVMIAVVSVMINLIVMLTPP